MAFLVKVTLRQKPISKERLSLYLDYYPHIQHPVTGKPTRREFLGLHVYKNPKDEADIEWNNIQIKIAKEKRNQRQREQSILLLS